MPQVIPAPNATTEPRPPPVRLLRAICAARKRENICNSVASGIYIRLHGERTMRIPYNRGQEAAAAENVGEDNGRL